MFALKLYSIAFGRVAIGIIRQARFLHVVQQNVNRGIFYVQLDDRSRAVLRYNTNGKVLDMKSIIVPTKYKGQGLARLLAETAFTYAILNDYYMYLSCDYLQKYYLTVKNLELEKRIIGPAHILDGPGSAALNPDIIHKLPDP